MTKFVTISCYIGSFDTAQRGLDLGRNSSRRPGSTHSSETLTRQSQSRLGSAYTAVSEEPTPRRVNSSEDPFLIARGIRGPDSTLRLERNIFVGDFRRMRLRSLIGGLRTLIKPRASPRAPGGSCVASFSPGPQQHHTMAAYSLA